ncbi:mechanosensitive ion channel family protein [Phaeocystidibacter luteus]|uniref:Mechanosensitive ion channel n=1 Tax=Phaeocystidibacter luteus TaxID=911197 RepID=A0A6N6RLU5_9FLAO|nr:mechanosensitive ion channel domain-containing protein [Phaeocystidibacter luteus]KAB2814538.1 mechanosensitive ion channel [Phaeocystidibacter luteus]
MEDQVQDSVVQGTEVVEQTETTNVVTGAADELIAKGEEAFDFADKAVDWALAAAPGLAIAIITLIIGAWVIKFATRSFKKIMVKRNVDESLRGFLTGILRFLLWIMLVISIASSVGIETTSFVAVLGAAGLAIGLALQGSLANFAGGVLILLFKPFKVGDVIDAQGEIGTVARIDVLHTTVHTLTNKEVIMPNGQVANNTIINIGRQPKRRVDFAVGIAYDASVKEARKVILDLLAKDERIDKDPAPVVKLTNLGDSSLDLSVRCWVDTGLYWDVYFDNLEAIKEALDEANIGIPFPQRDVHIISQPK